MVINTNGIKMATAIKDTRYFSEDEDPPRTSFQCRSKTSFSGYLTSLWMKSTGDWETIATIQVARMKKEQSFELMSVERKGYTTAPNRSTAIRIRL